MGGGGTRWSRLWARSRSARDSRCTLAAAGAWIVAMSLALGAREPAVMAVTSVSVLSSGSSTPFTASVTVSAGSAHATARRRARGAHERAHKRREAAGVR